MHSGKKSETNPDVLNDDFRKLQTRYKDYLQIYSDGSKEDTTVGCANIADNHCNVQRIPDRSSIFTAEIKSSWSSFRFTLLELVTPTICFYHNFWFAFIIVSYCMNHTSSKNPQIQTLLEKKSLKLLVNNELAGFIGNMGITRNKKVDIQAKASLASIDQTYCKIHFSPIVNHQSITISWISGKLHGKPALVTNFLR